MKEKIDDLLRQGMKFNFANNSYRSSEGSYLGKPSNDFLAWVATVEDFIIEHYGEDSSVFRLYGKFDDQFISGYQKKDFDRQHDNLIGSLKSCYGIAPKRNNMNISKNEILKIIFGKFHTFVVQLRRRYNGRSTLDVQDEYDVQDLLHCLLKIYFSDIRKEEWTPSYAGGSSRMDFLLKEEQLVIEVKMSRIGLADKDLGRQLIEDKAKYQAHQDCKRLICFTYDPEGRIVNPKGIQNDLNHESKDFIVEIIIEPKI